MGEDLESLSRSDLNARADELGIEGAEGMRSKAAVIEAIQAAGGGGGEPSSERKLTPLEARRLRMRRAGR